MDRRFLTVLGVSLVFALVVSSVFYQMTAHSGSAKSAGPTDSKDLVVTTRPLGVGVMIKPPDVKIVKIGAESFPKGAFSKVEEVLDRPVVSNMLLDEPVLDGRLAAKGSGLGLAPTIPVGMRAVSVRVNEVVSVAGFVGPGTRVDVLLTGTPNGSSEPQTTTVLQNVAVIASGHTLERNASGEAQSTPVITLLASPEDAERLTLASAEGKIQLSLRNPLDTHSDPVDAANAKGLYKGGTVVAAPPRTTVHPVKQQKTEKPPPSPSVLSIEVYQGDKKPDVFKFPEQSNEEPK